MTKSYKITPSVIWAFLCLLSNIQSFAQRQTTPHHEAVKIAIDYIFKQQKAWNLTEQDVKNHFVLNSYTSEATGVTHVFLAQHYNNVELHNALINVNVLPNGEILYAGNRFMPNLANAVRAKTPKILSSEAVILACKHLGIALPTADLQVKNQKNASEMTFDKGHFTLSDVETKLCYEAINDKEVRLAWNMNLDQLDGENFWSLRVDALTGEVLNKVSLTSHCSLSETSYQHWDCNENDPLSKMPKNEPKIVSEALLPPLNTYRVFPLPLENPSQGARVLLTDPADSLASPFGWHDINGVAGADFKTTRGNNAHVYTDWKDSNASSGDEPNGSNPTNTDLNFDFSYLPNGEPDTNRRAGMVNLFYMTNTMHDISFRYGFNEAAGNFQQRNYTGVAGGNDVVKVEAQNGRDFKGTPGSSCEKGCFNNAKFSAAADGGVARMEMYLWSRPLKYFHVKAPANLVGDFEVGTANFGAAVDTISFSGDVILVNDGSASPTLGCNSLINTNLTGKIALIDRGSCDFDKKALNAQQKGAIAVIICNVDETLFTMSSVSVGNQVTIPVIMLTKSNSNRIRFAAGNGLNASISKDTTGLNFLDSGFDNGIIAHEYTHGISSRLTGGPQRADCLSIGEQTAGEGWSDFFALALTAKQGDNGKKPRGTYNFLTRQTDGNSGQRRYPYSTDMSVNPLTYDDIIINSEAHEVGEVWASAIWDLYWAMVGVYGFDGDYKNTNSGNGRTLRLVMDGMKLQPCNPGFLDSRDAILAADKAAFGGQNQCLIWDVFARRGMGFNAKQGTSAAKDDNTEGYDRFPKCTQQLQISKTLSETVKPGGAVTVTIKVSNFKNTDATGVIVTDSLPAGTTYLSGSADRIVTASTAAVAWNIGTLAVDSSVILTYKISTDANRKSATIFTDDMESETQKWTVEELKTGVGNLWKLDSTQYRSGIRGYGVRYPSSGFSDQVLKTTDAIKITGKQPILRFYHKYETQPGFDGGVVQISTDNGATWKSVEDKIFKNPYRGLIDFKTFAAPNVKAFWGKTDSFVSTCVDLSSFIGQNIKVRFRFGTDNTVSSQGWFVDDVAVMDMLTYNSRVRVISAQKDTIFAEAPARGTIIDPSVFTALDDVLGDLKVKIYPNPTTTILNINILDSEISRADIQIFSLDGRLMWQSQTPISGTKEANISTNMAEYPSGMYVVKVKTNNKVVVQKVFKN